VKSISSLTSLPAGENRFIYENNQLWIEYSSDDGKQSVSLNLVENEYFRPIVDQDDEYCEVSEILLSCRCQELIVSYSFYEVLRDEKNYQSSCFGMLALLSLLKIPGVFSDIKTRCDNKIERSIPLLLDDICLQKTSYAIYETVKVIDSKELSQVFNNWLIRNGEGFSHLVMDATLKDIGFVKGSDDDLGAYEAVSGPFRKEGPCGISIWEDIDVIELEKNGQCDIETVMTISGKRIDPILMDSLKETLFWSLFCYRNLNIDGDFNYRVFFIALDKAMIETTGYN